MKRLVALILLLCALPYAERTADAAHLFFEPDTENPVEPDTPSDAANEALWDPNWVPAEEPDEAQEAFAPNGLTPRHIGRRPLSPYAQTFETTDDDLLIAARVAYLEAGGKDEDAYRAVLCVLYNRCMAPRFGGGVTDIRTEAFRKNQFSVVHSKRFSKLEPPEAVLEAARDVFVYGSLDLPDNVLFFHAAKLGKGYFGRKFYKNIGGNLFYYGSVD